MANSVRLSGSFADAGVGPGILSGQLEVRGLCGVDRRLESTDLFVIGAAARAFTRTFDDVDREDCTPCTIERIEFRSLTILFFDFCRITYYLNCQGGGTCEGSVWAMGWGLGLAFNDITFK